MNNVYEQVRIFYEEESDWNSIIKKEWVDGFLRQKAWQGARDQELKFVWRNMEMFFLYMVYAGIDEIEEMTVAEYSLAVEWLADHMSDFERNVKAVRRFFNILVEFYQYLASKKVISGAEKIQAAAETIAGGDKLKSVIDVDGELSSANNSLEAVFNKIPTIMTDDLGHKITETVERLMVKLGKCFQQESYSDDFDRALYLYTGPFDDAPQDEQDDFWLGFWDYFLFDYHLLRTDVTPLEQFYTDNREQLSADEREILRNLRNAQFTVFYISKVINQDWVECTNLFTDEKFQLPYPDFDYKTLRKLLFFGHIFTQGMVMINYVTSIEVSPNLRRRIKQEILRLKDIYAVQHPGAELADFFHRHAQVVRHSIDILITLAKVNVTSPRHLERKFPRIESVRTPNEDVAKLLKATASSYRFSLFDVKLMLTIWHDFCQMVPIQVRKPATWVAALIYAFSQINNIHNITVEDLAFDLGISASSLRNNRNRIFEVLQLQNFDARYLSEEGFIYLIFVP